MNPYKPFTWVSYWKAAIKSEEGDETAAFAVLFIDLYVRDEIRLIRAAKLGKALLKPIPAVNAWKDSLI